jgi:shikimate dehydrogenase
VLVREPARADDLRATAHRVGVALDVSVLRDDAPQLRARLVISTLPPRAADPLAGVAWHAAQSVLDVVYEPWPTAIAAAVSAAGGSAISGALMLLHQAAAQVRLMTGRDAPLTAMRAALTGVLPHAGL